MPTALLVLQQHVRVNRESSVKRLNFEVYIHRSAHALLVPQNYLHLGRQTKETDGLTNKLLAGLGPKTVEAELQASPVRFVCRSSQGGCRRQGSLETTAALAALFIRRPHPA